MLCLKARASVPSLKESQFDLMELSLMCHLIEMQLHRYCMIIFSRPCSVNYPSIFHALKCVAVVPYWQIADLCRSLAGSHCKTVLLVVWKALQIKWNLTPGVGMLISKLFFVSGADAAGHPGWVPAAVPATPPAVPSSAGLPPAGVPPSAGYVWRPRCLPRPRLPTPPGASCLPEQSSS